MSDEILRHLLPTMAIAAFGRSTNGTFRSLAPIPPWFQKMATDLSFPFLGHVLEEANMFWQRGANGKSEFGPCAEVGDDGTEFHYNVTAITADGHQYLVFQLDEGADRMREVLQKIRNEALVGERDKTSHLAVATTLRDTNKEIKAMLQKLVVSELNPEQRELLNSMAAKSVDLMGGISRLIQATIPHV